MEVTCEKCRSRLSLDDRNIPSDRRVLITCPRCGNKQAAEKSEANAGKGELPAPTLRPDTAWSAAQDDDLDIGYFQEKAKLALVMPASLEEGEQLSRALQSLGYQPTVAQTAASAIGRLRLYPFTLILLADTFAGLPPAKSPILKYLDGLSMSIRRHIFLTVLSDGLKTMEPLSAFALSADLVINRRELAQLGAILQSGLSRKEKFYKVFLDTMEELGKV